jgi:RimJ/RimL family protein N-acetyltransferase
VNPLWVLHTGRLTLRPVNGVDLPDLRAIKADPRVFAIMLGGLRDARQTAEELAEEVRGWGRDGYGIWSIRDARTGVFYGMTGLEDRPDGRGVALRFALWPEAQGRGLAREAASAALRYGHGRAGLRRIVAVARDSNAASRLVLGGIGMVEAEIFEQGGHTMVLYESVVTPRGAG